MDTKNGDMSTAALRELIASEDKRYEQRFLDQDKARDTAFSASKTAIETAITAQKTAMETAFTSAEKVSNKTEQAAKDRFEAMDKLLEQTRQQAGTFIPRQEWQITVDNFASSITELKKFQSEAIGADNYGTKSKSQNNWLIGTLLLVVTVCISVIGLLWNK